MIPTRLSLAIFVLTVSLFAAVSEGIPQRCEETTIQYETVYRNFSLTISADLKLSTQNKNIIVTNIKASFVNLTDTDIEGDIKNICAFARVGSINVCNQNFDDPITIAVGDSNIVELTATVTFNNSYFMETDSPQPFYSSIVDGNSFSYYDGRFYDDENNTCYNYIYDEPDLYQNVTECCNSMKPINISTPANTNACTHFTSTSTIKYDANNITYASVSIDYALQNTNLTMIGKFTNLKNYQPYLVIDDAAGCDEVLNNTIYCGYPLSPNGNKMLIFLLESINVNFSSYQVYGLANRIIIRDNQTFMNDNAAFTLANKCQTFNNPYDPARGLSISTTACCTEFQAVISTTTMGSSTTTSSSSPGTSPSTTNTQMPPSSSSSPASPSPASSSPPSTSPTSAGSKTFEHSNFVLSFFALIISFFMIKA